GAIRDAFHPHRAREEIGPGNGDLHGTVGQGPRELVLVDGQRTAAAEWPPDGGMTHLGRGDVERAQLRFEFRRVVDQRYEVDERDELAVVEEAAHEARVVVTALLTVGDDVDTGADLRVDGEAHRVARRRLELVVTKPPLEMLVKGPEHPARPGPAPDAHDRQRRDRQRGRGWRQRGRNAHRHGRAADGRHAHATRRRSRRDALDERTLTHEEATLRALPDE